VTAAGVTTERIRGAEARAEVIELLRRREPESTPALVSLGAAAPKQRTKLWAIRRDQKIVGVLVSARWCFDRWGGTLFLDDVDAADEMARALDRSNAWTVAGPVDGVEAVLSRAKRAKGSVRLWFYSVQPQPPEAADAFDRNTEVTIRAASMADLEALVDLYSFDEHSGGISRRRLRQAVRELIDHLRVAEIGGRVVGALAVPETDRYRLFNLLVVHPDARGQRLGMALLLDAGIDAVIAGRGVCGLRAMTNGLRLSHDEALAVGDGVVWAAADLRPPVRFRGQGRLRRLLDRLEGGVIAPPRPEPSPYSVLPAQGREKDPAAAGDEKG
jgi:GNAT superfamily N-acetyltransferase